MKIKITDTDININRNYSNIKTKFLCKIFINKYNNYILL